MADLNFEQRKQDHIRLSLDARTQWEKPTLLQSVQLLPEALPEIDFKEVVLTTESLGLSWSVPFFVSSMTAGHREGHRLNEILAEACNAKGWLMGLGSQRRELFDTDASTEWINLRKKNHQIRWAGNLGVTQLIKTPLPQILKIIENLAPEVFFIHLNPLQECLQPEGTPQFKDGLKKISELVRHLSIPVVVKEVGCGISASTAIRLVEAGVKAVDVSGRGGTHWGRIETLRSEPETMIHRVGLQFQDWGLDTVESLLDIEAQKLPVELWASGGVRSGVDAAKLLALGAKMIGLAQPFLKAAMVGPDQVVEFMEQLELELKTAMFCTGISKISQFQQRKVWQWKKI